MIKITWSVIVDVVNNLDLNLDPVTSDEFRGSIVFQKYRCMFIL